jgi:hypothetical protein
MAFSGGETVEKAAAECPNLRLLYDVGDFRLEQFPGDDITNGLPRPGGVIAFFEQEQIERQGSAADDLITQSRSRFTGRKMRARSARIAMIAAAETHFAWNREWVTHGPAKAIVFVD